MARARQFRRPWRASQKRYPEQYGAVILVGAQPQRRQRGFFTAVTGTRLRRDTGTSKEQGVELTSGSWVKIDPGCSS